jgi:hypothetical protein
MHPGFRLAPAGMTVGERMVPNIEFGSEDLSDLENATRVLSLILAKDTEPKGPCRARGLLCPPEVSPQPVAYLTSVAACASPRARALFPTAPGTVRRPLRLRRLTTRKRDGSGPRYCTVTSTANCPWPVGLDAKVYDLPASDAALPVAIRKLPCPEAAKPVTLPSVMVSASFPLAS